ncbi:MAG: hypothetical protein LBO62_04650, partial [Endomicrobium sp.]|nr:hypothetical protein [Endomicrobium sp.]
MNKKIIKTLSLIVFVFAALMFAPQRAFSLTVDTFTVTAFISFPDPKEVTLTHKQEIKVLNSSSIFITGNVASTFPGFNVHSISSVTITYNYDISSDSDTVVQADLTSDANTVFFEAVLSDLFLANSHIFYQIKVAYTLDGSSGTKTSAWHIVNNPNIKHTHLAGISALDKVFSPIGLAENLEIQKRTLYTSPMSYQFEIQYYYGEDNANISTAAIKLIGSNFEMESYSHILPADVSTFSYRIVVRYDGEAEREKRIPSIGYISVPVIT